MWVDNLLTVSFKINSQQPHYACVLLIPNLSTHPSLLFHPSFAPLSFFLHSSYAPPSFFLHSSSIHFYSSYISPLFAIHSPLMHHSFIHHSFFIHLPLMHHSFIHHFLFIHSFLIKLKFFRNFSAAYPQFISSSLQANSSTISSFTTPSAYLSIPLFF